MQRVASDWQEQLRLHHGLYTRGNKSSKRITTRRIHIGISDQFSSVIIFLLYKYVMFQHTCQLFHFYQSRIKKPHTCITQLIQTEESDRFGQALLNTCFLFYSSSNLSVYQFSITDWFPFTGHIQPCL